MNKYKIVSLVLAIALVATLVRLVYNTNVEPTDSKPAKEVVMNNILSRKSVRAYTDRPISKTQLDTLVRAAMAAPTGKDMRPWKFVIVDDKSVIDELAKGLPRAKMLAGAQAAIVVCGDMSITDDKGEPSKNWMLDCSAATENLLLMAESMGIGAVWTGVYPYEDRTKTVKEILNLPEEIKPLCVIPMGYPKGNPQPKDKYNKENVHYNKW